MPLNSKKHSIRKLIQLVRPYSRYFLYGMLALGGGAGINLLFPEIVRRILNSDLNFIAGNYPWLTALALGVLFSLQACCFYYRSYFFLIIGQLAVRDIRHRLFQAIVKKDIEFFDRSRTGDLVSRLSSDALMIQDAISFKVSVFIRYSLQVIFGIGLMLLLSPRLTCVIILCVPVLVVLSRYFSKKLRYWSRLQQTELGASSSIAEEAFSAIRVVKAFNREDGETVRYRQAAERVLEAGMKRSEISAFFSSFVSFLLNITILFVLFYGFNLVSRSQLSAGDLTAFIMYGAIVAVSFAFVVNSYSEFVQALGASERIFDFLDEQEEPAAAPEKTPEVNISFLGRVDFESVSFAYPGRPDVNVLQSLSFSVEKGSMTALVGPSGAGKSTIVSLILRFYEADEGEIRFDGISSKKIPPEVLRSRIAYVPQDPALFALSIGDNLRYANNTATGEELAEACRQANIYDFIESLPDKFDTQVGERGVQLSTGQKQRLSIARAILKKPAFLILDEATSALDSENEYLVQEALHRLMQNKTTLVIAHRLSTVKNASRIYVLDKGTVVQTGTHETLSRTDGLYRQLVEKQELLVESIEY